MLSRGLKQPKCSHVLTYSLRISARMRTPDSRRTYKVRRTLLNLWNYSLINYRQEENVERHFPRNPNYVGNDGSKRGETYWMAPLVILRTHWRSWESTRVVNLSSAKELSLQLLQGLCTTAGWQKHGGLYWVTLLGGQIERGLRRLANPFCTKYLIVQS